MCIFASNFLVKFQLPDVRQDRYQKNKNNTKTKTSTVCIVKTQNVLTKKNKKKKKNWKKKIKKTSPIFFVLQFFKNADFVKKKKEYLVHEIQDASLFMTLQAVKYSLH